MIECYCIELCVVSEVSRVRSLPSLPYSGRYKHFSFNSARIWNAICSKIDVKVSLVKFKLNLKKYLLHNTLEFTYTK